MAEKKPATFYLEEKALCPHCGEKGGVRRGMKGDKQRYTCRLCGRRWYDAPPPPPDRVCPYCKGRTPHLTPLQQWLGYEREAQPSQAQTYVCRQCGRYNTELWPDEHPKPNRPKEPFGLCRFRTDFLLNSEAEEALVAYCRPRKLTLSEGMREIFRSAAATYMGMGTRVYTIRPRIPPDMPMPRLPNGNVAVNARRCGKLFGHREVIIVRKICLSLDALAYLGLTRTMAAKKMTRQEAVRYLIIGTERKVVGMTGRMGDWVIG